MADIRFEYVAPTSEKGVTFVGYNALTGDMGMWESAIGTSVRDAGHGTLFWNLRGQEGTDASDDANLGVEQVVADALAVLKNVEPERPVHVGLSIGGLFAARAALAGAPATGMVLLNTLRAPGTRLEWINAAAECALSTGGPAALRDMYSPLLYGDTWLKENRANALNGQDWQPLAQDSMVVRLLRDARDADWDVPYESLDMPVLVVTGERDCVFRVPADVERLSGRIPRVKNIVMPEVGHLVPVEAPQELSDMLIAFAADL